MQVYMQEELLKLVSDAQSEIAACSDLQTLDQVREIFSKYLAQIEKEHKDV